MQSENCLQVGRPGRICYLPSCGVVTVTMLVNGPLPILVIAVTEKPYMVLGSRVSILISVDADSNSKSVPVSYILPP